MLYIFYFLLCQSDYCWQFKLLSTAYISSITALNPHRLSQRAPINVSTTMISVMYFKDTALAWLMPTNTATQRITLDHSRLYLSGSSRWLSRMGYISPTNTENNQNNMTLCSHNQPNMTWMFSQSTQHDMDVLTIYTTLHGCSHNHHNMTWMFSQSRQHNMDVHNLHLVIVEF